MSIILNCGHIVREKEDLKNQHEEKIFFWIIQASMDNHHFSRPAVRGAQNFPDPAIGQPRRPGTAT
jgi:hypothetical protein